MKRFLDQVPKRRETEEQQEAEAGETKEIEICACRAPPFLFRIFAKDFDKKNGGCFSTGHTSPAGSRSHPSVPKKVESVGGGSGGGSKRGKMHLRLLFASCREDDCLNFRCLVKKGKNCCCCCCHVSLFQTRMRGWRCCYKNRKCWF